MAGAPPRPILSGRTSIGHERTLAAATSGGSRSRIRKMSPTHRNFTHGNVFLRADDEVPIPGNKSSPHSPASAFAIGCKMID
jgi:hypothetical protein